MKGNKTFIIINNSRTGVLCTSKGVTEFSFFEANTFVRDFGGIVEIFNQPISNYLTKKKE